MLFPKVRFESDSVGEGFPLKYVEGSIQLFVTKGVQYERRERTVHLRDSHLCIDSWPDDEPEELDG